MSTRSTRSGQRSPVQLAALAFGVVFLLVGLLGFVPGITAPYNELELAGAGSDARLLGIFEVSVLHNLVHLLFGVAGIAMARAAATARNFLIGGGVIYLVLWIYGLFVANSTGPANFVPLNTADNWLHLFLAVGMIALGVLTTRSTRAAA